MTKSNETATREMVEKMVEILKDIPDGHCTSTVRLMKAVGYEPDFSDLDKMFELHEALAEAAEKEHIHMDYSMHEGRTVGWPYIVTFRVKHED